MGWAAASALGGDAAPLAAPQRGHRQHRGHQAGQRQPRHHPAHRQRALAPRPRRRHLPIGPPMSTILITGASSGLGAEMARQFAALGHDLALCARRTDRLETLRAEIAAAHPGVRVEVRALDVNDHDAVFRVFGEFRDALRHPGPGGRQRRPRQGPAAGHRPLRRQPRDRDDQRPRRARADRGGGGDLPRPGLRAPGDDLLHLRDARDAGQHHDVRRVQGRGRPPRRGLPRRRAWAPRSR